MMHVALALFVVKTVEHLRVAHRAECSDGENLRLTAGEHTGTVDAGQQIDFSIQRTHIVDAAAVHALAFVQKPATHNELLQLIQTVVQLCDIIRIDFVKLFMHSGIHGLESFVADAFVVGVKGFLHHVDGEILDSFKHRRIGILRFKRNLFLADFLLDAFDEFNDLLVDLVGIHDAVEHGFVVDFLGAGFDHGNKVSRGCNGHSHFGFFALRFGRVDDEFAVHKTDGHTGDRAVPGNLGNGDRDGNADHGGDFRQTVLIHAHNCGDNADVIAHILREQRADRTVDHAGAKGRFFAGTAFSSLERAGDLTDRIELFFKINGKREKVNAFSGLCRHRRRAKNFCLTVADEAGAAGKAGHFTGLDLERSAGECGFKCSEFREHRLYQSFLKIIVYLHARFGLAINAALCGQNVPFSANP